MHPVTKETTLAMEIIDKVITEGMIHSEKNVERYEQEKYPFLIN